MYDIHFFEKTEALKKRILAGELGTADVAAIEHEMDRLRDRAPHLFNMETTNYCNMTCVMCPRTSLMTRENQWIDEDLFGRVLDQISAHDPAELEQFWKFISDTYGITFDQRHENAFYFYIVSRCVILHGYGEPLVDRNIVKRVQACTDRGIPTYFSCVPANVSVERAERVMQAGLTVLKFSIDALSDDEQKRVRGRLNNFEKSYKTILEIIEMKAAKGFKTIIVPTMIALNDDQQSREMHQAFLDLWKGHDVFAYVKSQDNRWYHEEDDHLENRSHYAQQYCEYPWTSLTVMADGSVVPCTQDYDCEMALGNAHQNTLDEIWNGDNYARFRHWHATGDFPAGHKCLTRCDQVKLFQRLANAKPESDAAE
jgi:radical SAM protein with 4Fe4S-binding SPASM domain